MPNTSTVKIFDPPMCCSTGVCTSEPDIALARFCADIQWLQQQGVVVERFNLSQQPDQFVNDAAVLKAIQTEGSAVLPIIMVGGQIVSKRKYLSRAQLAEKLGLVVTTSLLVSTPPTTEAGCCTGPGKKC
jgi:thiamine pyrophosphate-dependent acetolactate synthase large subunit-like protein